MGCVSGVAPSSCFQILTTSALGTQSLMADGGRARTCLIRFAADQSHARLIERGTHNASLRIQGTGLRGGIERLESMARLPVPEAH